jgi:uncharacterized protein (TIGR03382 family)
MTIWLLMGMLAQEPAAPTGPASYWKFDETAAGTAANVVTGAPAGTPQGGPTVSTQVPALSYNTDIGATPRSLLFDGTNDVVNVANFGTFNRVTVSVWIRRVAGGPAGRQTIVSYKESSVGGFVLSLNESNGTFNPRLWVHNGGWVFAEEALAIAADTWVHLAGVYNGTNILLYRDGTQVASTAAAGNMTTGVGPIGIGARSSFDQHWFPGNIDDVRIYARALTPEEIAVLADGVPEPVLVSAVPGVNRVDLTWTPPAGNVTYTYNVKRAPSGSGAFVTIATGVSGTSYPDMSAAPGVPYDYVVTAVSAAESGQSGVMSATAQFPPPRTNDHDEGLMDGNCSCGSIAGGPSAWTLLLAFAALGASFRRR